MKPSTPRLTSRLAALFAYLLIMALLAGCNLTEAGVITQDPAVIFTQAAATVVAQLTRDASSPDAVFTQAAQTVIAQITASAPTLTPTPVTPTVTATPTATIPPSPTPTSPIPTETPRPTATPTPLPCDRAEFVGDINVPDGTVFTPGVEFTKQWRLVNVGECIWSPDYDLVFVSGDRMGADRTTPLPRFVRPGQTVDISVDMVAPNDAGTYRGYFRLRNADGDDFGVGKNADRDFWVQIRVNEINENYAYDFAASVCNAEWTSQEGRLLCPGTAGSSDGYVIFEDNPALENDRVENEAGLLTVPDEDGDGFIRGAYPSIRIQNGYRLRTGLACADDSKGCDVIFRIEYRSGNETSTLGEWREVYDGQITIIDIDLSNLAGQNVQFIFTVSANGRFRNDNALWWVPHIRR
jgi:hypothetical protein